MYYIIAKQVNTRQYTYMYYIIAKQVIHVYAKTSIRPFPNIRQNSYNQPSIIRIYMIDCILLAL